MDIALIGNCQIAGVRHLLASAGADIKITSLPAVHTLDQSHRPIVEKTLAEADWIFTQPIQDTFHVEYVRTSRIKSLYGAKTVVWPVVYFAGYAPEWNILKDDRLKNYRGPLLDYHSSKIIFGFLRGLSRSETCGLIREPSDFDQRNYATSVQASLRELILREEATDVCISDFISENFRHRRLFNVMNHPTLAVLEVVATRLLAKIDVKSTPAPRWMFSDVDLIQSWHPDNVYVRQKEGFTFPRVGLYRGATVVKNGSELGFATEGIRIYDDETIVDAFFRLYDRHRDALRHHPRVAKLMGANP